MILINIFTKTIDISKYLYYNNIIYNIRRTSLMSSSIKKNQTNNEEIIKYLEDVCQIEQAIYVIDQCIENTVGDWIEKSCSAFKENLELKRERHDIEFKLDCDYEYWSSQMDRYEEKNPFKLSRPMEWEYRVTKPNISDNPCNVKGRILGSLAGIFCLYFSAAFIFEGDGIPFAPLFILVGILLGITLYVVGVRRDKNMNRKEKAIIEEYRRRCKDAEQEYERAKSEYDVAWNEYCNNARIDITNKLCAKIDKKIAENNKIEKKYRRHATLFDERVRPVLDDRCKVLQIQLEKIYEYNIIPPDYRTLDCVLMLLHIYRNGLADNMRDAINLYETRVFRGELIKGLNNIFDKLEEIADRLGQVGNTLKRIESDISIMSEDMCKLVENSDESLRQQNIMISNQNDIIEQSKLNRMAMEAVASSMDSVEYYARKWDRDHK